MIFTGEKILRVNENQTLWKPVISAGVGTLDTRSIEEGILRYTSGTRLLRGYLKENSAHIWFAKKRGLLDVWLLWITTLLKMDRSFDDRLWIASSGVGFGGLKCVVHHSVGIVTLKILPPTGASGFSTDATAKMKASFFCVSVCISMFIFSAPQKRSVHCQRCFK